jgi:hypothetical protein
MNQTIEHHLNLLAESLTAYSQQQGPNWDYSRFSKTASGAAPAGERGEHESGTLTPFGPSGSYPRS